MTYYWTLNINNFTQEDRLDISRFILDVNNRWTQDIQVKKFEEKFSEYIGVKYAIFVSSGSTANTILAQYLRDKKLDRNKIILPSTTWQTSCSPWIREGFEPVFIDVSLDDMSMDLDRLENYMENNHESVACVFPTSLIGYTPNLQRLTRIAEKYRITIMMDNCENTLGSYKGKNISSYFTSTTSTYFGHQIQSVEGGFIFTNNDEEFEYFLMLRNHGMTRGLIPYQRNISQYTNDSVDSLFDFYCLGNNYRNTDINAFIGQKDLARADTYKSVRKSLYNTYYNNLDKSKFYLPRMDRNLEEDVPFCLPVVSRDIRNKQKAIDVCKEKLIEYRPIISGFLGFQTCYRPYFSNNIQESYPNSIFLHNNGFYVGLHPGLQEEQILELTNTLNKI